MNVSFGSEILKDFGKNIIAPQSSTAQPAAQVSQAAPTAATPSAPAVIAQTPQKDTFTNTTGQKENKNKISDYILKYSGLAAIAATPIVAVVMHKIDSKNIKELVKKNDELARQIQNFTAEVTSNNTIVKEVQKGNKGLWAALGALAGVTVLEAKDAKESKEQKDAVIDEKTQKEITEKVSDKIKNIENTAYDAQNTAYYVKDVNEKTLHSKYLENVNGFKLLKEVDKKAGFNDKKYTAAIDKIKTAAETHMTGEAQKAKAPLKKGDTVWSITSEFAPIKEGGLGAVPVDLQKNFEKLGIKTPTFIPMYQKNGFSTLKNDNGVYTYKYDSTSFNLDKVAEYRVHSYKHKESKDELIEVFVSTSKVVPQKQKDGTTISKTIPIPPIVLIKNDEYFNGTIYAKTAKTEEPEKFAFFDKAVYELAKAMYDPNSVKGLHIMDKEKLEAIGKPDGLVLNDWQAAPIAALSRYKAPMENAFGVLNDSTAKTLSDMKMITIGHNAEYQGYTFMDNDYHQKIEVSENILNTLFDNFAADIVKNSETKSPHKALENAVIMNGETGDRHVNFLNMGVTLSDYFCPVSENYAKELVNEPEKSKYLQWALEERQKAGTMAGIINGNDINNINMTSKKDFFIDKTGVPFKIYKNDAPQEEVIQARFENKRDFYNGFMKSFASGEKKVNNLENVGQTNLPELSDEEIKNTPIISYAHRLVEQKGVDILADSVKELYENWEKDFGDKPKPIFYIGGEDGEGGEKKKIIKELKEKLKPEDSNRVVFAHGFAPNPALMAATDFFLMPSKFEPCGLTQSEAFAMGTPVIATATGGIVDTVIGSGENQTGVLTKDINGEGFYSGLKEGLNIFFNDKDKYNQMSMNALHQDFSWIQPNRQGPIYDYLKLFKVDTNTLAEKSEL